MKKRTINFLRYRKIFTLSLPVIIANLSYVLLGYTDIVMVGKLGAESIAAVGISLSLIWLVWVPVLEGFMDNALILFSQAFGAKNGGELKKMMIYEVCLAFGIGLLSILIYFPMKLFLQFMTPSSEILDLAANYIFIVILGFPIYSLGSVGMRLLLATNHNKIISYCANSAVILNIVLAYGFIYGNLGFPRLELRGAALAFLIARGVEAIGFFGGSLYIFFKVLNKINPGAPANRPKMKWEFSVFKKIFQIGGPLAVTSIIESLAWLAFVGIVGRLGTAPMAAHEVSMRIKDVAYVPGSAIGNVSTSLVGQKIGKGDQRNAKQYGYTSVKLAALIMGIMSIIFLIFAEILVRIVTNDPEVVQLGATLLRFMAFYQIIDAVYTGFRNGLRGMGDIKFVRNMTLFFAWVVWIPLSFIFSHLFGWGIVGAWSGLTVFVGVLGGVYWVRFAKIGSSVKAKRFVDHSVVEAVK